MNENTELSEIDYLNIKNHAGNTNGVNTTFGTVNSYLGNTSAVASVFVSDTLISKAFNYISNKNRLLKAIFTSNSALDKKTIFSLTNVSSFNNFSIRLDFKENIVFTNSFYEKVA